MRALPLPQVQNFGFRTGVLRTYQSAVDATPKGNVDMTHVIVCTQQSVPLLSNGSPPAFAYLFAYEGATLGYDCYATTGSSAFLWGIYSSTAAFVQTTTVDLLSQGAPMIIVCRSRASDQRIQLFLNGVAQGAGLAITGTGYTPAAAGARFRLGASSSYPGSPRLGGISFYHSVEVGASAALSDAAIATYTADLAEALRRGRPAPYMRVPVAGSDRAYDARSLPVNSQGSLPDTWVDLLGSMNLSRSGDVQAGVVPAVF